MCFSCPFLDMSHPASKISYSLKKKYYFIFYRKKEAFFTLQENIYSFEHQRGEKNNAVTTKCLSKVVFPKQQNGWNLNTKPVTVFQFLHKEKKGEPRFHFSFHICPDYTLKSQSLCPINFSPLHFSQLFSLFSLFNSSTCSYLTANSVHNLKNSLNFLNKPDP